MREYREFAMKHIVVATDFSEASYGAINYARQLGRYFAAKVLVTHVIDPARSPQTNGESPTALPDRVDAAEDELERIRSSFSFDGIRCYTAVRVGGIREVVSELIGERNADLLVIGTSGKGYKNGEGLGSVAEMLLRSVTCPVLTIGKHVRQDSYENTHERIVLFPTDFSQLSRAAFAYTVCLTQRMAGRLVLLHVDPTCAQERESVHEKSFQEFTREVAGPVICEFATRSGDPAGTIVKVSAEMHADFIVMGVHGTGSPEDTEGERFAFDVIRLARCPVLTLSPGHRAKAFDHLLAVARA